MDDGEANVNASKPRRVLLELPAMGEEQNVVTLLDAINLKIDLDQPRHPVRQALFKELLLRPMTEPI